MLTGCVHPREIAQIADVLAGLTDAGILIVHFVWVPSSQEFEEMRRQATPIHLVTISCGDVFAQYLKISGIISLRILLFQDSNEMFRMQ